MFVQESDRSFILCIPGPGPGQCNIFFFNFLCAPVLTKSLLSICARQGCATSRVIHQPNNITAPHEGDGMSAAPSVAQSGTIRSSFRSSFRRESSSSQA